jgi:DNA-binding MarR family transcriptional regulator
MLSQCDVISHNVGRDVTTMVRFLTRGKQESAPLVTENGDVAKLFFDSFSKRVRTVEDGMRNLSSEIEKLKLSSDRSQVSDLVLLERLQKAEGLIRESLDRIKQAVGDSTQLETNQARKETDLPAANESLAIPVRIDAEEAILSRHVLAPVRELGTLPSITTPTELQVLTLLANEGPKSAPEIGLVVGRSREHTARLMKKLYQEGYVRRDQARIPFRYSLVERVKQTFRKQEAKGGEKEAISVPQT